MASPRGPVWWKQPGLCSHTDLTSASLPTQQLCDSKQAPHSSEPVSPSARWGQNMDHLGLLPGFDGIMSKLSKSHVPHSLYYLVSLPAKHLGVGRSRLEKAARTELNILRVS